MIAALSLLNVFFPFTKSHPQSQTVPSVERPSNLVCMQQTARTSTLSLTNKRDGRISIREMIGKSGINSRDYFVCGAK